MRQLADCVVVITGASSGIGRATAQAFAREGAALVLAARRGDRIDEVARQCLEHGAGACLTVPCDVSRPDEVNQLAHLALDRFGGFDVWVNNAAITAFGLSDQMPYPIYRQVIETNLLGCIHGARAALAQFRCQGRGVLINVSSMAGKIGHPYMSAYTASKYGVVGLSDSLRAELRHEPDIHVCTVLPVATDTPLFQHGANYLGVEAQPPPPVYAPERVARAIVQLARRPRRETAIGAMGKFLWTLHQAAPGLAERWMGAVIERRHFRNKAFPPEPGNVLAPTNDPYATSGGWKRRAQAERVRPWAIVAGLGIAALGVGVVYSLATSASATRGEPEAAEDINAFQAGVREQARVQGEDIATLASDSRLHLDRAR
jgi:short-subunit dehydrogenase